MARAPPFGLPECLFGSALSRAGGGSVPFLAKAGFRRFPLKTNRQTKALVQCSLGLSELKRFAALELRALQAEAEEDVKDVYKFLTAWMGKLRYWSKVDHRHNHLVTCQEMDP